MEGQCPESPLLSSTVQWFQKAAGVYTVTVWLIYGLSGDGIWDVTDQRSAFLNLPAQELLHGDPVTVELCGWALWQTAVQPQGRGGGVGDWGWLLGWGPALPRQARGQELAGARRRCQSTGPSLEATRWRVPPSSLRDYGLLRGWSGLLPFRSAQHTLRTLHTSSTPAGSVICVKLHFSNGWMPGAGAVPAAGEAAVGARVTAYVYVESQPRLGWKKLLRL